MLNKKRLLIGLITLIFTISLFNVYNNNNIKSETLSLILDYSRNTSHIGIINAQEEGFFEQEQVVVTITDNSTQSVRKLIDAKKYDLGISYQESITLANNNGAKLVSIAAITQKNPSCYGYRKDSKITKPFDLFDKNFAYDGSQVSDYILDLAAKSQSTTFTGQKITTSVNDYLVNPKSTIGFAYEYDYWGPILAKNMNNQVGCFNITDMIGINYYSPIIISQTDILKEKRSQIKKFKLAVEKGYKFALSNPQKSAQNLAKQTGLKIATAQESIERFNQYGFKNNSWGYQEEEVWNKYTALLIEQNIIENNKYKEWYENV
jgi:ABC-type nitrate/sulfonate/bicarbonate transport system substrate-binding protein